MSNKRVNPFKLKLHLLECEADEKDKKISDLEAKLAEMTKKYELASCPTGGLVDRVRNLEQQLAEKETDLSLARNEINTLKHNLNVSQEHDKVVCEQYFEKCKETNQDKISFCIEQLEKVKDWCKEYRTEDEFGVSTINVDDELNTEDNLLNFIDNQIKQLKEK